MFFSINKNNFILGIVTLFLFLTLLFLTPLYSQTPADIQSDAQERIELPPPITEAPSKPTETPVPTPTQIEPSETPPTETPVPTPSKIEPTETPVPTPSKIAQPQESTFIKNNIKLGLAYGGLVQIDSILFPTYFPDKPFKDRYNEILAHSILLSGTFEINPYEFIWVGFNMLLGGVIPTDYYYKSNKIISFIQVAHNLQLLFQFELDLNLELYTGVTIGGLSHLSIPYKSMVLTWSSLVGIKFAGGYFVEASFPFPWLTFGVYF